MARAFVPLLVCAVILLAPFETAAALKVASKIHCVDPDLLFSEAESRP